MSYKVHEQNGVWTVARDSEGLVLIDAVPISYELYQKLKDQPHRAADYYERRDGKLLPKSKPGPHN